MWPSALRTVVLVFIIAANIRRCHGFLVDSAHTGPLLTFTTSTEHGGTLTLLCRIDGTSSPVTHIVMGKGSSHDRNSIASIGSGNQNPSSNTQVGIDGHLDPTMSGESFLRVHLHNVDCSTNGEYYCAVTASSTQTALATVTICDDAAVLTMHKPDESDPTNFAVTCALNGNNAAIDDVLFMQVDRTTSSSRLETIAYANTSEQNTNGTAQKMASFKRSDVIVSGHINQSVPLNSSIGVAFPLGVCEDAGTYTCKVMYAGNGTGAVRFALAHVAVPNACVPTCMQASINYNQRLDPTQFTVSCTPNTGWNGVQQCSVSLLLDMELTFSPDTSPQRRLVAYLDTFSSDPSLTFHDNYTQRGMSGSASVSKLDVTSRAGTCEDTGIYRCKMVYQSTSSSPAQVKVDIAETRLPACNPGAVAIFRVTEGHLHFLCSVDPSVVSELISLEVSVVQNGHRQTLAFINSYMNGGRPVASTNNSVNGEIHSHDAASSWLSVRDDSRGSAFPVKSTATCKAVYVKASSGALVESLADNRLSA